jgi:uncharacterized membrane protein YfcA
MLAAAALGVLIGVVLGGLGGGGGVLTVPALVYLLGQPAQDATTSSVVVVGISAVAGVLARARSGSVDWRTAVVFGIAGVPAALLGTLLNRHVAEPVLLLSFAATTLVAAALMLVGPPRSDPGEDEPADSPDPRDGPRSALAARSRQRIRRAVPVVACGLTVGFLTGFLGVGGGFLVVPALVIALRMPMALAIGTSLAIITINALASFVSRVAAADLDWAVLVPFTLAAVLGTFLGKRVADRLSGSTLRRAFAVLLILVGVAVAVESVVSL